MLKKYLEENYSSTSVRGYENMINRFKLYLGRKSIHANESDILNYLGILRRQNLSAKSLRNNLSAIKIYYNYLIETGKRKDHPCRKLQLKDQINRQIQLENLYSQSTLEDLFKNYQAKDSRHQERNEIIISLLIYQALTALEISQLKVEDIDLENGTIRISENRKNQGRVLSLKGIQILMFQEYLKRGRKWYWRKQGYGKRVDYFILGQNGLQLWRSGLNRMINEGRSKSERLSSLKIRQSVIAHLLQANHDVRIVQAFAGHRRVSSTEAYQQNELVELKSAIEKWHPLQ